MFFFQLWIMQKCNVNFSISQTLRQAEFKSVMFGSFSLHLELLTVLIVVGAASTQNSVVSSCQSNGNEQSSLKLALKLVSAIFYQFFIFHQMIALNNYEKCFFISSKQLFSFSRYSSFCISVFPSFCPCHPLLQRSIQDKS